MEAPHSPAPHTPRGLHLLPLATEHVTLTGPITRLPPPSGSQQPPPGSQQQRHRRHRAIWIQPPGTHRCSPVHSCRKFSAVFGQMSANSSILMRPAFVSPMLTSAHGDDAARPAAAAGAVFLQCQGTTAHGGPGSQAIGATSSSIQRAPPAAAPPPPLPKKTTGFCGFGGLLCHCSAMVLLPAAGFWCSAGRREVGLGLGAGAGQESCRRPRPRPRSQLYYATRLRMQALLGRLHTAHVVHRPYCPPVVDTRVDGVGLPATHVSHA